MQAIAAALALAAALVASPAFADAVTYKGTIGKLPVVVEFTHDVANLAKGDYGRYFYLGKGVDIPLHVTTAQRDRLDLVEEAPCSTQSNNCPHADDDVPTDPALGATWALTVDARKGAIEGSFKSAGRSLPVALNRVGTRPYEPGDPPLIADMAEFAQMVSFGGDALTPGTSPYDFLKMQGTETQGAPIAFGKTTYRFVSDPRTLFQYPRIVDLGGADVALANAFLEQRDWGKRLDALSCMAQIYQGMGWRGFSGSEVGTLGGYDEEETIVTYLSPTVMSWTESGSLYCTQAHPYNHHSFLNLDIRTGTPLDLSRIFKDWVARDFSGNPASLEDARTHPDDFQWVATGALLDFIQQHRMTAEELGYDNDNECQFASLVTTNLAIGFTAGDHVLFALDGLPYAIQDCANDLYEAPISELKDLLAPGAAEYFPALAN